MEGELSARALPFEPADCRHPAEAVFDLRGLGAVAFEGTLGGDYPVGDDPARRKTVSFRSSGSKAQFVTLLELHDGRPMLVRAEAEEDGRLSVLLADGRRHELVIRGMDKADGNVGLELEEWQDGQLMGRDSTTG